VHQIDHRHADVSGGWLRAATFGAMDGLVSNTALIAGVAASASAHAVLLAGSAGLIVYILVVVPLDRLRQLKTVRAHFR